MPINLELLADCGYCDQKTAFLAYELPTFRLYADGLVVFREKGAAEAHTPYRWAQLTTDATYALLRYALDQGGIRTAKPIYRSGADDAGGYVLKFTAFYVDETPDKTVRVEEFIGSGSDPDATARARLLALTELLKSFDGWLADHGAASERLAPKAWTAALVGNEAASSAWPWSDLDLAGFAETDSLARARLTPEQARVVAGDAPGGIEVAVKAPSGIGYDVLIRPVLPGEDVPGAFGLRPDTAAIAASPDLRVRSRPEISDASVKLEPLLRNGQPMYVVEGPVEGSGYRWYHVFVPSPKLAGWVASASKTGEPWLAPARLECTLGASDQELTGQLGYGLMHVACFKGQVFSSERRIDGAPIKELERTAYCPTAEFAPVAPSWLNDLASCAFGLRRLGEPDTGSYDLFEGSVFHPGVRDAVRALMARSASAGTPLRVRVTGQMDHPDARACTGSASPPELVKLQCRRIFVITDLVALE